MDPVVHFEMPYDDRKRAAEFYAAAFGWKMQMLGEEMGNYMAQPSVVIAVMDIAQAVEKVKSAGGQVLGRPMDIPGIGAYVPVADTEGNRVGMLQPLPMKKAAKKKAVAKKKPAAKKAATKRKAKRRA